MSSITGACSRLMGELVHAVRGGYVRSASTAHIDPINMDKSNGRINKKKARQVVEKLELVGHDEQLTTSFDVEEVLRMEEEDGSKRNELRRQAFEIFDEDDNDFIDALELKRVLQCLGLDNGWDNTQIEKMLKVVDLNLDGKVDFTEFELMMSEGLNSKKNLEAQLKPKIRA
ncbi:putative calcium-binding protein CML43 [Hibiscus syriacus]|uniref:Calcium-binding protein CML43 n=1 Tax=Hibiscus syriacus TaxID=106335 RepID=A0A6A3C1F6_HIBSY|nr:putative calcium-binding protein CML43 [Hibiscus syriacus]